MVSLIGFPFTLDGNGNVITLDDASDDYAAMELAVLMLTNEEERELVPDFGIIDPTFQEFNEVQFLTQVQRFQIPVTVLDIEQTYTEVNRLRVVVEYDTLDGFGD